MTITTTNSKSIEVKNQANGAVADFSLPEGWSRGDAPNRPLYLWISKFFVHPDYPDCGFAVREPAKRTYGNCPVTENHFLQLLSEPAHELTEEEFLQIHLLLEHVSWPARFKRQQASTRYVEPFNVLEVQGLWLEKGLQSKALFLDTTSMSGSFVKELWFIAPPADFERLEQVVDSVFASLTWHSEPEKDLARAS